MHETIGIVIPQKETEKSVRSRTRDYIRPYIAIVASYTLQCYCVVAIYEISARDLLNCAILIHDRTYSRVFHLASSGVLAISYSYRIIGT